MWTHCWLLARPATPGHARPRPSRRQCAAGSTGGSIHPINQSSHQVNQQTKESCNGPPAAQLIISRDKVIQMPIVAAGDRLCATPRPATPLPRTGNRSITISDWTSGGPLRSTPSPSMGGGMRFQKSYPPPPCSLGYRGRQMIIMPLLTALLRTLLSPTLMSIEVVCRLELPVRIIAVISTRKN